jgi:hypothetical protein
MSLLFTTVLRQRAVVVMVTTRHNGFRVSRSFFADAIFFFLSFSFLQLHAVVKMFGRARGRRILTALLPSARFIGADRDGVNGDWNFRRRSLSRAAMPITPTSPRHVNFPAIPSRYNGSHERNDVTRHAHTRRAPRGTPGGTPGACVALNRRHLAGSLPIVRDRPWMLRAGVTRAFLALKGQKAGPPDDTTGEGRVEGGGFPASVRATFRRRPRE